MSFSSTDIDDLFWLEQIPVTSCDDESLFLPPDTPIKSMAPSVLKAQRRILLERQRRLVHNLSQKQLVEMKELLATIVQCIDADKLPPLLDPLFEFIDGTTFMEDYCKSNSCRLPPTTTNDTLDAKDKASDTVAASSIDDVQKYKRNTEQLCEDLFDKLCRRHDQEVEHGFGSYRDAMQSLQPSRETTPESPALQHPAATSSSSSSAPPSLPSPTNSIPPSIAQVLTEAPRQNLRDPRVRGQLLSQPVQETPLRATPDAHPSSAPVSPPSVSAKQPNRRPKIFRTRPEPSKDPRRSQPWASTKSVPPVVTTHTKPQKITGLRRQAMANLGTIAVVNHDDRTNGPQVICRTKNTQIPLGHPNLFSDALLGTTKSPLLKCDVFIRRIDGIPHFFSRTQDTQQLVMVGQVSQIEPLVRQFLLRASRDHHY